MKKIVGIAVLVFSSNFCYADEKTDTKNDGNSGKERIRAESTSDSVAGDFGLGVGIGVNSLSEEYINNAVIVNNKVNVTDSEKTRIQLWMEAHYLFGGDYTKWDCPKGCKVKNEATGGDIEIEKGGFYYRNRRFYHGPFFAVQVSDSGSIFNGAALGYMISLKKTSANANNRYLNIGLGVSTTKIRTLSGNLKDGDSVSTGEQLTYKTTTDTGVLLLFSVNVF